RLSDPIPIGTPSVSDKRQSLFLYMTPPAPSPTLFPYPTLFRSSRTRSCTYPSRILPGPRRKRRSTPPARTRWSSARVPMPADDQDRKSTRLNSSHVATSYAVFCLKKKKTLNNHEASLRFPVAVP